MLIDVSEFAKDAGFRYPVAVTAGVWAACVAVPDGVTGQDETGRLWDVLNMLRFEIGKLKNAPAPRFALLGQNVGSERVDFALHVRNNDRDGDPPLVHLDALCGPGDDAEPVITIMLATED